MSGDTAKRRATDQAGVVAVAAEVIPAEDIPEVVAAIPAEGEVVVAEVVAVEVRDHHSF